MHKRWARLPGLLLAGSVCLLPAVAMGGAMRYHCVVEAIYPHDPADSVQGLVLAGEEVYEGTGGYGTSFLAHKALATGRSVRRRPLPPELFGEGVAVHEGRLYQLTWKSGRVFVYDLENFSLLAERAIRTEGWGLASDGKQLILSDGSAVLHFYRPGDFQEIGSVIVTEDGEPVTGLNELEYVKGLVYANIFPTDDLVMIDPASGQVVGRADLSGLAGAVEAGDREAGVPNGIAYDPQADRLLITGKRWPFLFEIELAAGDGSGCDGSRTAVAQ